MIHELLTFVQLYLGHYNNHLMMLQMNSTDVSDEFDRELEDFKRFCFMASPLGNRPKVAVKMNLRDLTQSELTLGPRHNF